MRQNPPFQGVRHESAQSTRQPQKIRRFASFWIGAILLAFVLLIGGSTYAMQKLHRKTQNVSEAGRSLSNSHLFELAILSADRQHELWRASGENTFHQREIYHLGQAAVLLGELRRQSQGSVEKQLVDTIRMQFAARRHLSRHTGEDTHLALPDDALLASIRRYRVLNEARVQAMLRSSERLDRWSSLVAVTLAALAALILVAGSLVLWARIFKPVLALARVADEFGAGRLEARAPVARDDEMGALARTFNNMAGAIADREKERLHFVATVAHDLRNPLVVIGGAAQLLKNKQDKLTPAERAEWLNRIQSNTHKLENLILDLTDAVQIETGQLSLQMEAIDLAALAEGLVAEQSAANRSHLLRCHAPAPCRVQGDCKRLERVVLNLVSNAIKYSPPGSEVNVAVAVRGKQGVLTVADEGVGIAEADLQKLFLPFARLDRTRGMAPGTGLGLSSVKKIVEAHGGTIHITSCLNVGTSIEVRLPLLKTVPDNRKGALEAGS
jgi:signal transduction histidine kinase